MVTFWLVSVLLMLCLVFTYIPKGRYNSLLLRTDVLSGLLEEPRLLQLLQSLRLIHGEIIIQEYNPKGILAYFLAEHLNMGVLWGAESDHA